MLGKDTPLRSLEMAMEQTYLIGNCDNGYSCVYTNSISWRTPTDPKPMETNPRIVFQRLFGDGGSAADRLAQMRRGPQHPRLGHGRSDAAAANSLGVQDRHLSSATTSIRCAKSSAGSRSRSGRTANQPLALPDRPVGVPEAYEEHARLMFDLAALAFQADITRVFTFTLGKEQTNRAYPELGVSEAHHAISHHQHDPVKLEKAAKINTYHLSLTAHFLEKLKATPEGDGNAARSLADSPRRRHQRRGSALAHRSAAGPRRRRGRREGRAHPPQPAWTRR